MTYIQNTNSLLQFKWATRNVLELLRNALGLRIGLNWPLSSWTVKTIWFICQCAKITAGNHSLEEVLQLQWCNTSLSLCEMPSPTLWVCIPFLDLLWTGFHPINQSGSSVLSWPLWKQRASRRPRLCQHNAALSLTLARRDVPNFGYSGCRIVKIRAIALVLTLKAPGDTWCHNLTVVRCPKMDNNRNIIDNYRYVTENSLPGSKASGKMKPNPIKVSA